LPFSFGFVHELQRGSALRSLFKGSTAKLIGGLDIIRAFSMIIRYFLLPLFLLIVVSPGLVSAYLGHTVPPQYIILSIELLNSD
jgi:hypothetical protein